LASSRNKRAAADTPCFYLSATHKSSGKTVVSIGLCAALVEKGLNIQTFKKGPDYIDPIWLTRASGNDCFNLDFNTQSHPQVISTFLANSSAADIAMVEGNKGLHDGVSVDGSDSNAELADLLSVPVVLVLDTQGTTRGVAPLLLGYQQFDPRIDIAGVILNKVAGARHEDKLRSNIEAHTSIPVLGAVPRDKRLQIDERHLGLVPSNELTLADARIASIKQIVRENVDMEAILERVQPRKTGKPDSYAARFPPPDVRIGIPRDRAFGFYYPDDLAALRKAGAELMFFDTLSDPTIPDGLDGLFIGGGFPEVHMSELSANRSMRQSILDFVSSGGPTYAECGGMMYLGRTIRWGDQEAEMVGALPLRSRMRSRPVGRGYVQLSETGLSPWGRLAPEKQLIPAHEFHYSEVELLDRIAGFAYDVRRGWGIDGQHDGLVLNNVLANYSHLRSVEPIDWAVRFVRFVRRARGKLPAERDVAVQH